MKRSRIGGYVGIVHVGDPDPDPADGASGAGATDSCRGRPIRRRSLAGGDGSDASRDQRRADLAGPYAVIQLNRLALNAQLALAPERKRRQPRTRRQSS